MSGQEQRPEKAPPPQSGAGVSARILKSPKTRAKSRGIEVLIVHPSSQQQREAAGRPSTRSTFLLRVKLAGLELHPALDSRAAGQGFGVPRPPPHRALGGRHCRPPTEPRWHGRPARRLGQPARGRSRGARASRGIPRPQAHRVFGEPDIELRSVPVPGRAVLPRRPAESQLGPTTSTAPSRVRSPNPPPAASPLPSSWAGPASTSAPRAAPSRVARACPLAETRLPPRRARQPFRRAGRPPGETDDDFRVRELGMDVELTDGQSLEGWLVLNPKRTAEEAQVARSERCR
jgi:hypothetical protein